MTTTTTTTTTTTNTTLDYVCDCDTCCKSPRAAIHEAPVGFYRASSIDYIDRELYGDADHFEVYDASGEILAHEATKEEAATRARSVLRHESRKLATCGAKFDCYGKRLA